MKILITGGTGLIGTRLVRKLAQRGDRPVVLTRHPDSARHLPGETLAGDPTEGGPWMEALADCDAVVNLAGANLFARRWSPEFKNQLVQSRVRTTQNIVTALSRGPRRSDGSPKILVSGSAIGYYGPQGNQELTESSPPGDDFLARLAVDWEQAAQAGTLHGLRVVQIRTGVVLDPEGGALPKMLPPFKMFLGGPVGSGKQVMSWIHHEDMTGILLLALDNATAQGPMNATAPNPVTNREFSTALGKALHRPSLLPAPAFALRIMLGEVAALVTTGQRVLPRRAEELGYRFRFPHIQEALNDIVGKK